jgi:hypothetical protein
MVTNFALNTGVEGLAAAEANLHCRILSLYIDGHCVGV